MSCKKIIYFLFLSIIPLLFCLSCKQPSAVPLTLEEIRIACYPKKTNYFCGEKLDLTGIVVEAIYSDDHIEEITDYKVTPNEGTCIKNEGEHKIEIIYQKKKASFNITTNELAYFENPNDIFEFDLYSDIKPIDAKITFCSNEYITVKWYKLLQNNIRELLSETHEHFEEFTEESKTYSYTPMSSDFSEHGIESHKYECEIEISKDQNIRKYSTIYTESCVMPDTGLMCLYINTDSGEDPTGRYLKNEGITTSPCVVDKEKMTGTLKILQNNNVIYDSKEYKKGESGITIKLRGNSSAYKEKKPYKIKLQKKADLLFRGNKEYNDKDWVLLADGTSLDAIWGFETSKICGFEWVTNIQYVDLVLNNTYRGTYLLAESVKKSNSRINISDTGFILERDGFAPVEKRYNQIVEPPIYFTSKNNSAYAFKFPDDDDLTKTQIDYAKRCIDELEDSFDLINSINDNYDSYIDVPSFARYYLVQNIVGQRDYGGANKFISKYDDTNDSKMKLCTTWDFQIECLRYKYNKWTERINFPYFFDKILFESENRSFVTEFQEQWKTINSRLYEETENYLTTYKNRNADTINSSRELDNQRWNIKSHTVEEDITEILEWLQKRIAWINDNISNL